ncbi:MAG TPA: hypothetical protein VM933_02970 [Acidimicrobiales bacterium]|nr:hypothetical protein [Acidimicrobiales bacterium]
MRRTYVRVGLAAAGLSMVAAACGGGDPGRDDDGAVSSGIAPTSTTASVTAPSESTGPAPPTTAEGGTAPPATAPRITRTAPTTATPDGGDGGPPATSAPAARTDGSLGPPGAFARTLLRPTPATAIVVERFHQRGAEPRTRSVTFAVDTLRQVTGKSVDSRAPVQLDGTGQAWTADQIRSVADRSSRVPQGGSTAVLRVLFLGGAYEGSSSVLGVAVRGDTLAVFSESVTRASTPALSGGTIEEAVLVHELGHLLGLVDLVRKTGRADPDHPEHSPNPRSVMYWAVETDLIGQVLSGPPPREFDEADLADLRALRDGAE